MKMLLFYYRTRPQRLNTRVFYGGKRPKPPIPEWSQIMEGIIIAHTLIVGNILLDVTLVIYNIVHVLFCCYV